MTATSLRTDASTGWSITSASARRTISIISSMWRSMTAATNASLPGKYW